MKRDLQIVIAVLMVAVLGACTSSKKITYFQDADIIDLAQSQGLYDMRITPKDLLSITVFSSDRETAAPFNQTVANTLNNNQLSGSNSGMLQTYLVDNDGNITFPEVGKIHVQGLTKNEAEDAILERISPSFNAAKPPVVTVKMSSYRVTVWGEVSKPSVIPVATEKISIVEALAYAGDLTIYGKRDNVMLIREDATGKKSVHRLDLTKADLINSPYYYLQQNDIVYVEPNRVKVKNSGIGQSTTIWFSVIGILTSVTSLIVNLTK